MTEHPTIPLRGVRVHNLQAIDVSVPLAQLTVVTGVSGAGKSSLVFDTIHAEAQRRYLQSFSPYIRQFLERSDKPDADFIGDLPPAIAVRRQSWPRSTRATVGTLTEILDYLGLLFIKRGVIVCRQCGQVVKPHQPADVLAALDHLAPGIRVSIAFPSRPSSAGDVLQWAADLREDGFVRLRVGVREIRLGEEEVPSLNSAETSYVVVDRLVIGQGMPERLHDSIETAFFRGEGRLALLGPTGDMLFDRRLVCPRCDIPYPEPQPRIFQGQTIAALCALSITDLRDFVGRMVASSVTESERKSGESLLIEQIQRRLTFLLEVDLGYLSLDRAAPTLSAGETGRVRLAAALATTLAQAMYLFEEPTAGLHASEVGNVIAPLQKLRDAGNTVIVIDHNLDMVRSADYVIDLGPGAGEEGGRLLYQGSPTGLPECTESVTGAFLHSENAIAVPGKRRPLSEGYLRLRGANLHNLQDVNVDFPLGVLCVVTGVSGAGKSTLVEDILYPALCQHKHKKKHSTDAPTAALDGVSRINDVVLMDQEPLPRSSRSNPATYLKIFDEIRELFADTSEARIRNFGPGAFSFNQPGGRCEVCQGQGTLTIDMRFLADVTMTCPECHGARFRKDVLNVKVRSLSIAEVLNLTVRQAFRFFRAQRTIEKRLKILLDVGLDYLRLGQPMDTLSGGEAQRLKLAGHLASGRGTRCLFILLEPSTGLHLADVEQLLACFQRLLETGHSLLVVEHHLDVIKCADHVIDLGPGGGAAGGRVVATGTPEEVALVAESRTGAWLRAVLPGMIKA